MSTNLFCFHPYTKKRAIIYKADSKFGRSQIMQYDFNAPVDRSKNFSLKYDELKRVFGREDIIPLWVADMDLPTAQPIIDAIDRRNKQGIFGYTSRPESYFRSLCRWQEKRNGWQIDPGLVSYAPGVVPALAGIVQEFSNPGDSIAFFTPVYPQFFHVVENWDRIPATCQLIERDGYYTVDFDAFEQILREKRPPLLILCNPHNPVGRVWNLDELQKIGELCLRYGVKVISDEIHSDIILFGNKHIPFASISDEFAAITFTCLSASKTFNLAGLQAAFVVSPNTIAKKQFDKFWSRLDLSSNNCFSLVAVEAAFNDGEEWLEQVLRHFEQNMVYVQSFLQEHIPEIAVRLPECTYLMWLNCKGLGLNDQGLADFMVNKAKLGLNRGVTFGKGGEGYMRLNVACPIGTLEKAMQQLKAAVDTLMHRSSSQSN